MISEYGVAVGLVLFNRVYCQLPHSASTCDSVTDVEEERSLFGSTQSHRKLKEGRVTESVGSQI